MQDGDRKRKASGEDGSDDERVGNLVAVGQPNGHPTHYSVLDEYSFLEPLRKFPFNFTDIDGVGILNSRVVALQCVNYRGAMAHGRMPTRLFLYHSSTERNNLGATSADPIIANQQRVEAVVEECLKDSGNSAACNHFTDVNGIKGELIHRGPVVSVSFKPRDAMKESWTVPKATEQENGLCCCMIVGEVWLVLPPAKRVCGTMGMECPVLLEVAMGQYDIDRLCLAPRYSFLKTSWNEPPYFDEKLSNVDQKWRTEWKKMNLTITMLQAMELLKQMPLVEFGGRGSKEQYITVRDIDTPAHSRRARILRLVRLNDSGQAWRLVLSFDQAQGTKSTLPPS